MAHRQRGRRSDHRLQQPVVWPGLPLDPQGRSVRDIVLLLLFGGGFGYSRYGYRGEIGIGGVLLIILILYLLLGHGRM